MKKTVIVLLLLLFPGICGQSLWAEPVLDKQPHCPIILVHGLGGWGSEKLAGNYYWGGKTDLKEFLEENGYEVYVSNVGALSSNWDRAIELYYEIKGGQVDFGLEHSKQFGHLQRPAGKHYDHPLYPQWDADHPIHLVSHSMGGQTIRVLSALMSGQDPRFRNILRDADDKPFTPGNGWIKSITTLSAPHNGTALYYVIKDQIAIVTSLMALGGINPQKDITPGQLYSFELEQWGLTREANESLNDYIKRVFNTLGDTKDISTWDTSIAGAQELNSTVNFSTVDPEAYYFSYENEKTFPVGKQFYLPDLTINPTLSSNAFLMGILSLDDPFGLGDGWRENDGEVNSISMIAPQVGCTDGVRIYKGLPQKGVWNYLGKLKWDHGDVTGNAVITFPWQVKKFEKFYLDLAAMLRNLE